MKKFAKGLGKLVLVLFVLFNGMLIFQAYSLSHFYEPGEVIIKKQADKTGWDITKEILFGPNFVKQKNSVPDSAVQTLYFTTANGLKLEAWLLPTPAAKGTVALFHGHGGKKSSLLKEAEVFRKLGYNALLLDFRAHGGSQGNTCSIGFKEAEDVKLAYNYLIAQGEKNIILYGVSLGAATITKAVNDYKLHPSKIILDMPFASLSDGVKGRLRMMKLPEEPLSTMLTFWGGTLQGFWGFNNKPYVYARQIKCPVLLQWGRYDNRVTRQETEKIYNNVPGAKKLVIYESSSHESLCKKETIKWTNEVTAFIQ